MANQGERDNFSPQVKNDPAGCQPSILINDAVDSNPMHVYSNTFDNYSYNFVALALHIPFEEGDEMISD